MTRGQVGMLVEYTQVQRTAPYLFWALPKQDDTGLNKCKQTYTKQAQLNNKPELKSYTSSKAHKDF